MPRCGLVCAQRPRHGPAPATRRGWCCAAGIATRCRSAARAPGTLGRGAQQLKDSAGVQMFANRLGKNLKRLRGWAEREGISCYRLYDADMPEYAFAIDTYRTVAPEEQWLYVQEYAAPAE